MLTTIKGMGTKLVEGMRAVDFQPRHLCEMIKYPLKASLQIGLGGGFRAANATMLILLCKLLQYRHGKDS
jgi:hypothetical protein